MTVSQLGSSKNASEFTSKLSQIESVFEKNFNLMSTSFQKQQDSIIKAIKQSDKKKLKDIKKELKAIDSKIRKIESAGTKDNISALQQVIDKLNQQSDALA